MTLVLGQSLPIRNRDHALDGGYASYQECRIESDWFLIYRVYGEDLELLFFRTGAHGDLF